jgi:hypothetical protein
MTLRLTAATLLLASTLPALAEPLQLALWDPVQLRPASASIEGLRLNLVYGRNRNLSGLDFGLVNRLDGSCTGWQGGAVNRVDGSFTGIQDGWLYSEVGGPLTGLQTAALTRAGTLTGIQWGLVNLSGKVQGVQVGLYNQCSSLRGLQVGLLNRETGNPDWPFLPLLRWSF